MDTPVSIHDLVGACKPSGAQLNYQMCPICGDDRWKYYINPENGRWFCFNGAHYAGGVLDTTPEEGDEGYGDKLLAMLQPKVHNVEHHDIMLPPFKQLSRPAGEYLWQRGVRNEQQTAYGMVEQQSEPRIIVPYTEHGYITYWTARAYAFVHGPKYMYPTGVDKRLFFTRALPEKKEIVIVEGVFDALAVERAGFPAVAIGGKTVVHSARADLLDALESYAKVYIMLDWDALGDSLALKEWLDCEFPGSVLTRPCTAKDPAEMEQDEIRKAINP